MAVLGLLATACVPPANPPIDAPGVIASTTPMANTPDFTGPVTNGFGTAVLAVAQVGGVMVAGGTFTGPRKFLAAWAAPSGALTSKLPTATVDGEVDAIEPTPGRTGFYVAGKFKNASGVATRIALYSLSTGKLVNTFKVAADGAINALAVVGTHLLVGGFFTHVDGAVRDGLASVNATTGAVEPYFNIQLTGHHNFGKIANAANSPTGAKSLAVSPDGSHVIVDGNFTNVKDSANPSTGYARDQIVSIRMTSPLPTVDPNWATRAFTPRCDSNDFDSYVQDIAWSPDGSYFVVVDTGGYAAGSFQDCDSASRFNASAAGLSVAPVWTEYTGADSLYSVAVTSDAVYVGGHQRWLNNPYGGDTPSEGAVPRPGLAALDPTNGVPLAWNPGRNPRGHGAEVVYGTKAGIWVGSDTGCIGPANPSSCTGPGTYVRDELAFFPYSGGSAPAGNSVGAGTQIWKAGSWSDPSVTTLSANTFTAATGKGRALPPPNAGGVDWSVVRGAFFLDGRIWYGKGDGKFYDRAFALTKSGPVYGPETFVDPYSDPTWDSVLNGSPPGSGNTYAGSPTDFYTVDLPKITAMFYANRSIYYTVQGDNRLFRRAFSPGLAVSPASDQYTGGVISPVAVVVVDSNHGGLVDFTQAGGMWVVGGHLFIAHRDSGVLYEANWNGGTVTSKAAGRSTPGVSWAAPGVFIAQ